MEEEIPSTSTENLQMPGETPRSASQGEHPRTLAIDIGGTGVKSIVLDAQGAAITERVRVPTPKPATPKAVLRAIESMLTQQGEFERISAGFPGVVRNGKTWTAHNLSSSWVGFDLAEALQELTGRPCRVANDADVQGFAVIAGRGVELVLTLGTGVGSALFVDGRLVPNLELAHHHYRDDETYEDYLGRAALEEIGKKKWNKRLVSAVKDLEATFNYDALYLGGGNSKKITAEFASNVHIVSNVAGLLGGIALWRFPEVT